MATTLGWKGEREGEKKPQQQLVVVLASFFLTYHVDCAVAKREKSTTRYEEQVQEIHKKIATVKNMSISVSRDRRATISNSYQLRRDIHYLDFCSPLKAIIIISLLNLYYR